MPRIRRTKEQRDTDLRERAVARIIACGRPADDPVVLAMLDYLETLKTSSATSVTGHLLAWVECCARRGWDPLEVDSTAAAIYERSLDRDYAPMTVSTRMAVLRSLYNLLGDRRLVVGNPFRKVGRGKALPLVPTPSLTQDQFEMVASMLFREVSGAPSLVALRDAAMFYLIGRVGPRRFEVCYATWGDIGLDRGLMVLRIMGKGKKPATLTLPDDLIEVIELWRSELEDMLGRPVDRRDAVFPAVGHANSELVDAARADRPLPTLTPRAITRIFSRIFGRAGLGGARMAMRMSTRSGPTVIA